MANLSNRNDLAGTPSKATTQAALVAMYDFIASRFARGTAGVSPATDAELSSARESLGVGGFTGKNLLINGNFQINQRKYVSGTAVAGANRYTLDRWRVVVSGQSLAFSALGNGNQITAPAGGVEQVIEGANIAGGNYVLNWVGTATATVNGTARAKGESFTLLANVDATVRLIGGAASLVQLEPGTTPTPFDHLLIGSVRDLCRDYCREITGINVSGYAVGGAAVVGTVGFGRRMRRVPDISGISSPNLSNFAGFQTYGITADNFGFGVIASTTGMTSALSAVAFADAEIY